MSRSFEGSPEQAIRNRARLLLYKRTTPPWKEIQRMRLRERVQNGRDHVLSRFRAGSTDFKRGASQPSLDCPSDWLIDDCERLQREMVAEQAEWLLEQADWHEAPPDSKEVVEQLMRESVTCPLCQTSPAQLTAVTDTAALYWLSCKCGLHCTCNVSDALAVRARLCVSVERHAVSCAESDVFFTQQHNVLIMLCAACGFTCQPLSADAG